MLKYLLNCLENDEKKDVTELCHSTVHNSRVCDCTIFTKSTFSQNDLDSSLIFFTFSYHSQGNLNFLHFSFE